MPGRLLLGEEVLVGGVLLWVLPLRKNIRRERMTDIKRGRMTELLSGAGVVEVVVAWLLGASGVVICPTRWQLARSLILNNGIRGGIVVWGFTFKFYSFIYYRVEMSSEMKFGMKDFSSYANLNCSEGEERIHEVLANEVIMVGKALVTDVRVPGRVLVHLSHTLSGSGWWRMCTFWSLTSYLRLCLREITSQPLKERFLFRAETASDGSAVGFFVYELDDKTKLASRAYTEEERGGSSTYRELLAFHAAWNYPVR